MPSKMPGVGLPSLIGSPAREIRRYEKPAGSSRYSSRCRSPARLRAARSRRPRRRCASAVWAASAESGPRDREPAADGGRALDEAPAGQSKRHELPPLGCEVDCAPERLPDVRGRDVTVV